MDKNQVIGFILIFAVLMIWSIWTAPSEEERKKLIEQKRLQDSIEWVMAQKDTVIPHTSISADVKHVHTDDSILIEELRYGYGSFAEYATGREEIFTLENDDVLITFSSLGGVVKSVQLKNYLQYLQGEKGSGDKGDLMLLDNEKNIFSYTLPVSLGRIRNVETKDLYFNSSQEGNSLAFSVITRTGQSFIQEYVLADKGFHIDYSIAFEGLDTQAPLQLNWINYLNKLERNVSFERNYSTVYFKKTTKDRIDYCSCTGNDTEDLKDKYVDWVSHSNQFFNTSLISANQPFSNAFLQTQLLDEEEKALKLTASKLDIPFDSPNGQFDMFMYMGPNEYTELVIYNNKLEQVIPFGRSIFGSINRHFIRPFFDWLSQYISSKGIVIIVLIFIVKMALYPLMYKMLYSQSKMGALKPELASLKEKFKDDPQKQQLETMKIYREYGVSPFGGCMPMLLQMPIWYAMFRFFPASITFRQESFLWADDLSSYDSIASLPFDIPMFGAHLSLFTILWAITTIIYTYYNTKHMDLSANPAMKYVQYFMPVGFLVFFNSYASGLTIYMFFSNLINILQTIITKNFVFDEEKIRQQLLKNKSKPKKKSGFQARLEEAMKKQQTLAAQNQKNKNKK